MAAALDESAISIRVMRIGNVFGIGEDVIIGSMANGGKERQIVLAQKAYPSKIIPGDRLDLVPFRPHPALVAKGKLDTPHLVIRKNGNKAAALKEGSGLDVVRRMRQPQKLQNKPS